MTEDLDRLREAWEQHKLDPLDVHKNLPDNLQANCAKADALIAALEAEMQLMETAHAVEVTGLLRSFMGYLAALTSSGSDMVTFVAQKLEPYHAFEDKEPTP